MAIVEVNCPHCEFTNNVPHAYIGREVACLGCKEGFIAEDSLRALSPEEKAERQRKAEEAALNAIILTTETDSNLNVVERIEIITAECAFGMNIFRDFFAEMRDIFGGRSGSTQTVLRDARKKVLEELRKEALAVGANAVVGVDLDYSEFSGGGKSMLFVVASGTAVRVE